MTNASPAPLAGPGRLSARAERPAGRLRLTRATHPDPGAGRPQTHHGRRRPRCRGPLDRRRPPSASPAPSPTRPRSLNAAGATFPAPLYQKWFDEYAKLTQVQVNYQAIGSGGGIKGIQDQTVDFGASDAPMTDEQLKAPKAARSSTSRRALGAIVPTYNVPGVKTKLKFTGDTLAGIFLGDITKWNDPKLVADNPALANVNQDIVVVHRSDGSGTTFGLTDYLSDGQPGVEVEGRQGYVGQLADRPGRHGQRRRRRRDPAEPVLDRLRRADLRAPEQDATTARSRTRRASGSTRRSTASPPRPPTA